MRVLGRYVLQERDAVCKEPVDEEGAMQRLILLPYFHHRQDTVAVSTPVGAHLFDLSPKSASVGISTTWYVQVRNGSRIEIPKHWRQCARAAPVRAGLIRGLQCISSTPGEQGSWSISSVASFKIFQVRPSSSGTSANTAGSLVEPKHRVHCRSRIHDAAVPPVLALSQVR